MPKETVLREVKLDRHEPTGNTLHIVGGSDMPPPAALRISVYGDEPGFFLLYLDERGNEVTDTWHQSLDDALHQAHFEFQVEPSEWRVVADAPRTE